LRKYGDSYYIGVAAFREKEGIWVSHSKSKPCARACLIGTFGERLGIRLPHAKWQLYGGPTAEELYGRTTIAIGSPGINNDIEVETSEICDHSCNVFIVDHLSDRMRQMIPYALGGGNEELNLNYLCYSYDADWANASPSPLHT
jgi:hypothetical protein